ncbi:hypothetical protein GQ54DRAFT_298005 [Martensiomyces pterosporus]|nr:hypothetical protein GQ54DRAFT_298005 [Martensiomyces pterosporus]
MTTTTVAVVAVICTCIVVAAIAAALRVYRSNGGRRVPLFAGRRSPNAARNDQSRSERREARKRRHEEIQDLSPAEVLGKLEGSRAQQNYTYACEHIESHPLDEGEGCLSNGDLEYVMEHGVDAWEFRPASENTGITVQNRTEVEFSGGEQSLVANLQFPNEQRVYYFEVRLDELHEGTNIAVGVAMKGYPPLRMAGWAKGSVAYHSIDGCAYYAHPLDVCRKSISAHTSDTLGVGWRPYSGKMFFAVNGAIVCHVRTPWIRKRMYPIVSADGPCSVSVNMGSRAFVLSHANMRYWGLAPPEGSRPPPPLYQKVSETLLLATSLPSDCDISNTHGSFSPPSYDVSEAHSAKHSMVDVGELSGVAVDEDELGAESGSGSECCGLPRIQSSPGMASRGSLAGLAADRRRSTSGSCISLLASASIAAGTQGESLFVDIDTTASPSRSTSAPHRNITTRHPTFC